MTLAAQNALEIVRVGRLAAPYSASFDVVHEDATYRLRRYTGARVTRDDVTSPVLLIPPLMVASEVYDISPDISVVGVLLRAGVDVWLTDFGAPEHEEGGMDRTLDDHVRAVSDAIGRVRDATGRDVHLSGYSQGGMFAYQAAAYRRADGVASVITFGSPVDIHRNVPNVSDSVTEHMLGALRTALGLPIERTGGLPGFLTSTTFKLLSVRKEVAQFADFLTKLHDRQALEKRESKRLFMRGQGFVAWPGPAFRKFVDDFVVANRMATGGFVIDGRTVSLADIDCPVLCFIGERDDMARPAAVRAIRNAAPNAEVFELSVKAGHFGLVVGSTALAQTWPTVIEWVKWRDGAGNRPGALPPPASTYVHDQEEFDAIDDSAFDVELAFDVISNAANAVWDRLGDLAQDLTDSVDHLRYQVPRLSELRGIQPTTRISVGYALHKQAREIPDSTFFLWQGRAFTYGAANERVDHVVRGLLACGVRSRQHVAVLMSGRPSYLTAVTALNRLGAVAVLLGPGLPDDVLEQTLVDADVGVILADPDNAARARKVYRGDVLVLGGGADAKDLPPDVVDMEAIDPDAVVVPSWYAANPGRAGDLAMIVVGRGRGSQARLLEVTNQRWAFSALGAAATCTLTPKDTVYACLPLHHAAGTMVAAGSALVSGARLALASGFSPDEFWGEVRRYGATVVFYAGEMCRGLVDAPHARGEAKHPVRLFAGSGMRRDVWERVARRFGVGVLEFYATTEANVVLANASGEKVGCVGRPMPGSNELAIAEYDFATGRMLDRRAQFDRAGVLVARARKGEEGDRIRRDLFADGDAWYVTGDLVRQDVDGDYWYVDRIADLIDTATGKIGPRPIEDALYQVPGVALAVAYGVPAPDGAGEVPAAAIVVRKDAVVLADALRDRLCALPIEARPRVVRVVDRIDMTDGFRPRRAVLRAGGLVAKRGFALRDESRYERLPE